MRRLLRNRSGTVGLLIITVYLVIGLLGAFKLTPYSSTANHPLSRLKAAQRRLPHGHRPVRSGCRQPHHGKRDEFAAGGALSVALAGSVGTLLGTVSGYAGGRVDNVIMRIMDVFFALPALLMALVIVTVLGAGINTTVLAIAIVYTPIFARVARGPVLSVKAMEFILAARALGVRGGGMLWRHVLPNTLAPLIVQVSWRCRGRCSPKRA